MFVVLFYDNSLIVVIIIHIWNYKIGAKITDCNDVLYNRNTLIKCYDLCSLACARI